MERGRRGCVYFRANFVQKRTGRAAVCYTPRRMEIIRDPGIISGFRFEHPLAELPALTHCGEVLAGPSHVVSLQTHPGFEFHYMVKGTIAWRIRGQVHRHGEGEVSWTPPLLEHESVASDRVEHHFLWIGLHLEGIGPQGPELARCLAELGSRRRFVFPATRDVELVLRCMLLQIIEQRERSTEACAEYLRLFATLLLQSLADLTRGVAPRDVRPFCFPVVKALKYMKEHLGDRIPLGELAVAAGLGKSQLSAHFAHEVGESPAACHLRQRLEAAREVLMDSEMSITQVAHEYGFSSSQHFTKAFRQAFGLTPLDWQRSHGDR